MDPRLTPLQVAERAVDLEEAGYDGIHLAETVHDPLSAALLVGQATTKVTIRTAVVVAFARSPMLLAYQALDAQIASQGRFELGLGTQIQQVIEGRYAMNWEQPVQRLGDYVLAIRSVLQAFINGTTASVETETITIDRVPEYFNPGPIDDLPTPPIYVGAVRPRMIEMAGALADGMITHPTSSDPAYLKDVALAHLDVGESHRRSDAAPTRLVISPNVVTGIDTDSFEMELARQRHLLSFLLTTPAYAGVLERAGEPELGASLRRHLREHGEADLGRHLPRSVLDFIVPSAAYGELAAVLAERYEGLCDEIVVAAPAGFESDSRFKEVLDEIRSIPGRR